MKKHFFKQRKGITLIALIVTIVVLIILATISINAVIGEDGIIKKAEKTNILQSHAAVQEAIKLAYVDYEIEQRTGGTAKAEETKLASVETTIKLAEASEETFLEYLVRKGYADANGVINVKKLLGNSTGVGNGSGNTDIYKIEETEDGKYELNYYGEEEKIELGEIGKVGGDTTVADEILTAPEEYAERYDISENGDGSVMAYLVEREGETESYDMLIIGEGAMYNGYYAYDPAPYADLKDGIITVKISKGVTNIGKEAFSECNSLTSVKIPNSVTNIEYMAFSGCRGLTSIEIPDSVTSIGVSAFGYCTSLKAITYKGTITQWESITLGIDWDSGIPATTVQCSDETVNI